LPTADEAGFLRGVAMVIDEQQQKVDPRRHA
jgi:hypothetical protein